MAQQKILGNYSLTWAETTANLEKYIAMANKAGGLGVATDFYQRETLAAAQLKVTNDSIIKQMETLSSATKDQLGGSTGQKRVDELVSFGNFKGNTGVGQLAGATTQEEKYKAVLSLIQQAQDAGERLAAIDVAKTFFGQAAADNLQKDQDYFTNMERAAAKMQAAQLIPDADVSRALDLQTRLQNAEETISKKWFPAQRDGLNPLVMAFKELWVEIVELVAGAFSWVEKIVKMMLSIPGDLWQKFQDWRHGGDMQGPQQETPEQALARANTALKVGMQNPNTVLQSTQQAQAASDRLRPDKSKSKAPDPETKDAYDRAEESLRRYTETANAAAASIDLTTGAQERLKAIAQLTAAGMKDGLTREAAAAKAEMSGLATAAGLAADALAKAKIASQINFGRNTALLSPEDVSIATQLKGLYPDVATALASVQAQGLRTNTALSGLSSTFSGTLTTGLTDIIDGTKSAGTAFQDMSKIIIRAIEEMIVKMLIIQPLMRAMQAGFGGVSIPGLNPIAGISGHAAGTDSSPGGWHWVGENGPELMNVPKGAKVLPNGTMPGGGGVTAPVAIHIDATGADAAGLARVQEQLASLQVNLPATIVKTVQKAQTNRVL